MSSENKIRGIKEQTGIATCTYGEAIAKVKPFYDKAIRQVKPGIEATLFLTYNKSSLKQVREDLERGTP